MGISEKVNLIHMPLTVKFNHIMCIEMLLNLICSWPSGLLVDPPLYEVVVDSFCVFSKR